MSIEDVVWFQAGGEDGAERRLLRLVENEARFRGGLSPRDAEVLARRLEVYAAIARGALRAYTALVAAREGGCDGRPEDSVRRAENLLGESIGFLGELEPLSGERDPVPRGRLILQAPALLRRVLRRTCRREGFALDSTESPGDLSGPGQRVHR